MEKLKFQVEIDQSRFDLYVSMAGMGLSRSMVKTMIERGEITLNGKVAKPSAIVSRGDEIEVAFVEAQEAGILPQNIPIDIVYEDDDLAVINKQKGLTVHPSETQKEGTLVNALLFHIKNLSGINGEIRPGIVHRLDKNTSGLLVIAKNDTAHRSLAAQIENKTAKRKYLSLVMGNVKSDSGVIDAPIGRHKSERKKMAVVIGGRRAITEYKVLERFSKYTLVEFTLKTGRTHQIRVHSKYIGHPIVGDDVYAKSNHPFAINTQLLHSFFLSFSHPTTGEIKEFKTELPEDFEKVLKTIRNDFTNSR